MGRRSWRPAVLLVIGLASVALGMGRGAPAVAPAHEVIRGGRATVAEAASIPSPHVGSLLELRRVGPDGGTKTFALDFATLSAACSLALVGSWRARQRVAGSRTRAVVPVPCGLRAPPAARA